jgi:PTH1 family peptidyl-tRNA hydrolase
LDAARQSFRLIVGLGNPGREYEYTRHNMGFMVLNRLAARIGAEWRTVKDWHAQVANSQGVLYCKPTSFMNLSGRPVGHVAHFYKVAPAETLVVLDDAALPLGKLRFRANGSAGGHNGMKSIIENLSTLEVPRLKIGIGEASKDMVGHVLGRFTTDEAPLLEETLDRAVEAIGYAQTHGIQAAMNQFN